MLNSPYVKGRRLRVFGGPNGSGKTTIIDLIKSSFDVGFYINADDIEKEIRNTRGFNISNPVFKGLTDSEFKTFIENHSITKNARLKGFQINLELIAGKIHVSNTDQLSYEAALIAEFLRQQLIELGRKMTFETVMSHPSKVDILKKANQNHYKTYLYFVCTSSHEINIERVKLRVRNGGHHVDHHLIEKRYYRSLELLKAAVNQTYRSFIWDNSGKNPELTLEVFEGNKVITKTSRIPRWVDHYLLSRGI